MKTGDIKVMGERAGLPALTTAERDNPKRGAYSLGEGIFNKDAGLPQYWTSNGWITLPSYSSPERLVYVAKNGNDTTGTGEDHAPYASIKKAVEECSPAGVSERWVVFVAPGSYTENPITVPEYVSVVSLGGHLSTEVVSAGVSDTLITLYGNAFLKGFTVSGASSGVGVNKVGGLSTTVEDVFAYGCGVCFKVTEGSVVLRDIGKPPLGAATDFLLLVGGSTYVEGLYVAGGPGSLVNAIRVNGSDTTLRVTRASYLDAGVSLTNGLKVENQGTALVRGLNITGAVNGFNVQGAGSYLGAIGSYVVGGTNGVLINGGKIEISSSGIVQSTNSLNIQDMSSEILGISTQLDRNTIIEPVGFNNIVLQSYSTGTDEPGLSMWGEMSVGRPEKGYEFIAGEGDSFVRGMKVYTTDSSATSVSEGSNLTEVTSEAKSSLSSSFSFQGTQANHTILIGCELSNGTDVLKHWGIKVQQLTACVEATQRSFGVEVWDGTKWVEVGIMATHSRNMYTYSNQVFLRGDSSEHIRYGITPQDTWVKKTIDGSNLYWSRIIIKNELTTAPIFEKFKIHSSRFEANEDGTNTFHGTSRFRKTIISSGNVFGSSGTVVDSSVAIGNGGLPTGWTHVIKDSTLTEPGDAIYAQFNLPKGLDTSMPLKLVVTYQPTTEGVSSDASFIVSLLPLEVNGVEVADPAGGEYPVPRSLANTRTRIGDQAASTTVSADVQDSFRLQTIDAGSFSVSDFYEGDMAAVRVELDDPGDANKYIIVWSVEVSGVQWKHGERLT